MFRTNNFDKLLDKATSHLLMEPDLPSMLALCDLIRQNDVQPKYALGALKKKLSSTNTHTASFALSVLESMVKNCGSVFHEELTSKAYCDSLHEFAKTTTHENVRQKLLELLQTWSFAFRKNPKHSAIKDLVIAMKSEGYKFPAHRESDAMFTADSAPEWADGEVCHRCRVTFNILQRKHHCRACGQVFCGQCTQKTTTLPKFGIEKEVRVCDSCYEQASKPSPLNKAVGDKQETDLPLEYLNSSLSHQNQEPPRKNEDELREEEELQLALALSQSEAEAKEKTKPKASVVTAHVAVKESLSVEPPPAALIEEEADNPELAKYLNRSYWESRTSTASNDIIRPTSPSAPIPTPPVLTIEPKYKLKENGVADNELEAFISTLRSQVEIFINRMKSNSSRGRSIANDTSVQTLFMNITAMHSKLLNYIQQHDDSRLHYERLQDKLTQVKDARAALDALREEHRDKLRREAEEAERLRQLQMAHKLDIMRKKKQEYLQYQRQLALQRIQEQEREMQMRQEQQKQQYLMGPQMMSMGYMVPNVQQYPPNSAPYMSYSQTVQQGGIPGMPPQSAPPQLGHMGPNQGSMQQIPHQMPPPGFPPLPQPSSNPAMNMSQQGLPQQQMNQSFSQHGINSGSGMNLGPPGTGMNLGPTGSGMNVGPPGPGMNVAPQGAGIGGPTGSGMNVGPPTSAMNVGQPGLQNRNMQNQGMMGQGLPPQHYQQPGAPPASPQMQQLNGEAQTAELISFD